MGMFTLNTKPAIRPGDLVRIHEDAPQSGMVPEMEKFLGTVQKVERKGGNSIMIKGFYWSIKDVTHIVEPSVDPKDQKPVKFNEDELVEG